MIPKKIHFVWLGSELPELHQALIRRCKKLHPGWRVRVWDDEHVRNLVRGMGTKLEARLRQPDLTLSTKSDLARYHIVAREGGIYLDTDFLILRPLDSLLHSSLFGVYQQPGLVCSGVFGAVRGHPVFSRVFEHLRQADYGLSPERLAGPLMFSPICRAAATSDSAVRLLPPSSFLPVHYDEKHDWSVWLNRDLKGAYAVHLWAHSWGPNGGDEQKTLLGRIGALLLNRSLPEKQGRCRGSAVPATLVRAKVNGRSFGRGKKP
jgi:mannosyltransferase OCH1-like enzyme